MRIMEKQVALPFVILDFFLNVSGLLRSGGGVYFQSSISFKRFEIVY